MNKYDLKPSHVGLVRDMINDFHDELEGVVCCCMAAGVSSDMFVIRAPELKHEHYYKQKNAPVTVRYSSILTIHQVLH